LLLFGLGCGDEAQRLVLPASDYGSVLLVAERHGDPEVRAVTLDPEAGAQEVQLHEVEGRISALFLRPSLSELGLAPGVVSQDPGGARALPPADLVLELSPGEQAWTEVPMASRVVRDIRLSCPRFEVLTFKLPITESVSFVSSSGPARALVGVRGGLFFEVTVEGLRPVDLSAAPATLTVAERFPDEDCVWLGGPGGYLGRLPVDAVDPLIPETVVSSTTGVTRLRGFTGAPDRAERELMSISSGGDLLVLEPQRKVWRRFPGDPRYDGCVGDPEDTGCRFRSVAWLGRDEALVSFGANLVVHFSDGKVAPEPGLSREGWRYSAVTFVPEVGPVVAAWDGSNENCVFVRELGAEDWKCVLDPDVVEDITALEPLRRSVAYAGFGSFGVYSFDWPDQCPPVELGFAEVNQISVLDEDTFALGTRRALSTEESFVHWVTRVTDDQ
jgi:hypothetical protein